MLAYIPYMDPMGKFIKAPNVIIKWHLSTGVSPGTIWHGSEVELQQVPWAPEQPEHTTQTPQEDPQEYLGKSHGKLCQKWIHWNGQKGSLGKFRKATCENVFFKQLSLGTFTYIHISIRNWWLCAYMWLAGAALVEYSWVFRSPEPEPVAEPMRDSGAVRQFCEAWQVVQKEHQGRVDG